jgi:hypothetical protein
LKPCFLTRHRSSNDKYGAVSKTALNRYASARFKPAVVVSNTARVVKHAVLCAS